MRKHHPHYANALTSAKVVRRQLLDQVTTKIVNSESQTLNPTLAVWSDVGSIERQCDLLEKLLKECSND